MLWEDARGLDPEWRGLRGGDPEMSWEDSSPEACLGHGLGQLDSAQAGVGK